MKNKSILLILLFVLSVVIRIFPAFVTPIPYNVDALTDARASQYIGDSGNMQFPENASYNNNHTPVTPLFNSLCAAIYQLTGVKVLIFIPFVFPFITALSVLGWYLLAKRTTGREDIAFITAFLFAVGGTYVLQTALVWKEALGFVIMPITLYTYRRKNTISIFLLSILPLVHHYVALITYLIISYHLIITIYEKYTNHLAVEKEDLLWIVATPLLWLYLIIYYTTNHFNRLNEISPNGTAYLFVSLFILLILGTLKLYTKKYRGIKPVYHLIITVPIMAFYAIYFYRPVFAHTMTFEMTTLVFTLGYIILLPLATTGIAILLLTRYPERKMYFSTLIAPLQMLLFFMLRGLDLESYVLVSRNFDFMDFSYKSSISTTAIKSKHRLLAVAMIIVLISTTTPIAYHTSEAFGVCYFIYPHEYHAAGWIKEHFPNSTIDSDDKLFLVARNGFDIKGSSMLPYEIKEDIKPISNIYLVGDYWNSGAQMSPMAPIKVNVTELLEQNSVVFSSGHTFVLLNNTSESQQDTG